MTNRELFDRAVEVVLDHEGEAYTDNPLDRGGPTKFGISHRWNRDLDIKSLTRAQAIEVYWKRYWLGNLYEYLPEAIAIKVFDMAVNLGNRTAVKCLQRALSACDLHVVIDGLLGAESIEAARQVDQKALMAALRSEAGGEYRLLLARHSDQAIFKDGWLYRAYA